MPHFIYVGPEADSHFVIWGDSLGIGEGFYFNGGEIVLHHDLAILKLVREVSYLEVLGGVTLSKHLHSGCSFSEMVGKAARTDL